MRTSKSIFWGGLLILLGIFWLLRNMGYLHIDWHEVARFWPVLLILAGISLLLSGGERRGIGGGLAGILVVLAVLGAITNRTERAFDRQGSNWNFDWDDEEEEWDSGKRDRSQDRDRKYEQDNDDESSTDTRDIKNGHYEYEMENSLQEATLNFEGGAGTFKLDGSTDMLFEAKTRSSIGGFVSNIRNNRNENTAVIDFKMEDNQVKLKRGKLENKIDISLNEQPIWNIDLGVGAGKADFDLTKFKVKTLKVSTGVADMDVRLGDKVPLADVNIESGVASVTLEIPESVGCEVRIDGALNVKNMDDLVKVDDDLYRSPGFDKASRKIMIRYDAGLSKVKIRRY